MKPCAQNRESLALLACRAPAPGEATELRDHLQGCAGCREYFGQMSAVCESHTAVARELPDVPVSLRLRSRISAAVSAGESRQRNESFLAGFTGWGRLAGVAALVVLLLGGFVLVRRSAAPVNVVEVPVPPPAGKANVQSERMSLNAYRLALNRSPEDLEQLLTHEAARPASNPMATLRSSLARLEPYTISE